MESKKSINFYGTKIYRYKVYNGKNLVYTTVVTRPPEEVMPELQKKVYWSRYEKARVYCNGAYIGFFMRNNEW